MRLSTQTETVGFRFGYIPAVKMLAQAGFDALDFSCFQMTTFQDSLNGANYAAIAREIRTAGDDCGVVFNQAHAPFSFNYQISGMYEKAKDAIIRSMEIAAILGVPNIVVHPLHFLPYRGCEKENYLKNQAYYRELLPYAEQFGICICTENMWRYDDIRPHTIVDASLSRAQEFADFLDEMNTPYLRACLDLGHCPLVGEDTAQAICTLGKDRLKALHVHDNDFYSDAHQIPYQGRADWPNIFRALKESGYSGDLTFEADNFLKPYPDEFIPTALKFLHDTGRMMIRQIQKSV